jgi:hypothetical protein
MSEPIIPTKHRVSAKPSGREPPTATAHYRPMKSAPPASSPAFRSLATHVFIYIDTANQINELSGTAPGNWTNTVLPSNQVRSDSPLAALALANGDPRIYYIDTSDQINELAWVGIWVNNILPSAFGGAQLVAPYSGLTCFAMNGTDSRVYYAGRFGRLSSFNWVNGAWENEEFALGGPAGFITLPIGGAMASFQVGDIPHVLVIQNNILCEVQPAVGGTDEVGPWKMVAISHTPVRQPSSMSLGAAECGREASVLCGWGCEHVCCNLEWCE